MKLVVRRIRARYLLTSLIIISVLLLGSSCVYIQTPQSPPSTPAPDITVPANPEWTPPPVQSQSQPLPDFVSVVAKVKPSVVAINTRVTGFDIFNRPFTQEGAGSGWILDDKEGYIVTNNHVIEGAESITVTLADGRTLQAGVVGTDALEDLAVLKINAKGLVKIDVGDSSQTRVGEWVLAVGNSLGLGITAKEGIVSRTGVSVPVSSAQTLEDLIETSAAINPGNSGGPLVNMKGEVIGVTSVKIATVGVEGMGYAISTKTAIPTIEELVRKGYVVRPWLGVAVRNIDEFLAFRYDLSVDKGAFVTQVAPGSPADKAGIEPGDVIVGFDDGEINNAQELIKAIHSSAVGQRVEITFWRGDVRKTAATTLTESPPP